MYNVFQSLDGDGSNTFSQLISAWDSLFFSHVLEGGGGHQVALALVWHMVTRRYQMDTAI
jgi:hypothetical protein